MMNDQHSPTNPTQTPPSEPESSTGPNQLTWEEHKPSVFHADTKGGRYVVYDRSLYSSTGWKAVYLQDRGLPTAHLYKGHSEAEARAAAQAHHNAMIRRLAWEQYMRDNDPPSSHAAALDELIENAHAAQISADLARQVMELGHS